jgi:hypothetical protein
VTRWEGYKRCKTVPSTVCWYPSEWQPNGYHVWYGDFFEGQHEWGAPFRRIDDLRKSTTTFYSFTRGLRAPTTKEVA